MARRQNGDSVDTIAESVGCSRSSVYSCINFYKNNPERQADLEGAT